MEDGGLASEECRLWRIGKVVSFIRVSAGRFLDLIQGHESHGFGSGHGGIAGPGHVASGGHDWCAFRNTPLVQLRSGGFGMGNKKEIETETPNLVISRSQAVAKGLLFYPFSTRLAQPRHHDNHTESCTCCISI